MTTTLTRDHESLIESIMKRLPAYLRKQSIADCRDCLQELSDSPSESLNESATGFGEVNLLEHAPRTAADIRNVLFGNGTTLREANTDGTPATTDAKGKPLNADAIRRILTLGISDAEKLIQIGKLVGGVTPITESVSEGRGASWISRTRQGVAAILRGE